MKFNRNLLIGLAFASIAFYINQSRNATGVISIAKIFWLFFCLYFWFLFPLVVLAFSKVSPRIRRLVKVFALLMWIRGILEVILMFGFKAWRPPYGLSHDMLCVLAVSGVMLYEMRKTHHKVDGLFFHLGGVDTFEFVR